MKGRLGKRVLAIIMAALMVIGVFDFSCGDVSAASFSTDLEKQIILARADLASAIQAQEENEEKLDRGTLGFIEYMLAKKDLTAKQKYDLERAQTVMLSAIDENFSKWAGGDNTGLPDYRNGKVTVMGDKYDAISLTNMDTMFSYLRMVNTIRAEDDLYVGSMKRNPGKTNFYLMAVAQTGADRGAGLKNHSLLQVSCENLAFGQNPYVWLAEKSNFKTAMSELGMTKLSSESDLSKIETKANELKIKVGHYMNLFWAADQIMGIGFTNYDGTCCYNASKLSNYTDKFEVYTIDQFEALYNEYYATVDPDKFQADVEAKQKALDDLLEQYYSECDGHTYGATRTVEPTCTREGYDLRECTKCGCPEKTNIVEPLGHDITDGVCSRCSLKTVKSIKQINWREGNYTNTTYNQKWEEGKVLDFSIDYTSASDYKWGDQFIIDISDPSVVEFVPGNSNNSRGTMTMLKPGLCIVKIYPKDNPALMKTITVDVTDIGGHNYEVTPLEEVGETSEAVCSKCGRTVEVTVPTIKSVGFSNDNSSFGTTTDVIRFKADSVGYLRVYLNNYKTFSGISNNTVMVESSDPSIVKQDTATISSTVSVNMVTGKHGVATLTIYPKYNPADKKVFKTAVVGSDDTLVSSIELNSSEENIRLYENDTIQLSANVLPEDAFIKDVKWTSTNTSVLTVDENGKVTALKPGYANVRASSIDGSFVNSGYCGIRVYGKTETPEVTIDDFTVGENKIETNLTDTTYRYRIFKNGSWTSWSKTGTFTGLTVNTEYEVGVKAVSDLYVPMDDSDETVITIKTSDHTPVMTESKAPTCTEPGYAGECKCSVCGKTISEPTVIPATGHDMVENAAVDPTCQTEGNTAYWYCKNCEKYFSDAFGENEIEEDSWILGVTDHHYEEVEGTYQAPTCTEDGKEADTKCSGCDDVIEGSVIPATGHKLTRHAAAVATCKAEGNDEYWSCDTCNKYFSDEDGENGIEEDSWVIEKKDHDPVEIPAVEATCTEPGMTAGTKCSVCDETIIEPTVIPAKGHDMIETVAVEPKCESGGNTAYWYCKTCKKYFSDADGENEIEEGSWILDKNGHHYEVVDGTYQAPTCTEDGKEADTKCSGCDDVIEGSVIPATGHMLTRHAATKATCKAAGNDEYWSCDNCDKYFSDEDGENEIEEDSWVIEKKDHDPVEIPATDATCTSPGMSAGSKCSVCGEYIEKPVVVTPALGHTVVIDPAVEPTYTSTGLTEGSHCSVCHKVIKEQQIIPAKTDNSSGENGGNNEDDNGGNSGNNSGSNDVSGGSNGDSNGGSNGSSNGNSNGYRSTGRVSNTNYKNEWVDGKWYDEFGNQAYAGTLTWKSNAKGWWVEDSEGWYPTNQWQKIDGVWYFFKPDGYMASAEYYNGYWFNSNGSWDSQYKLTWKSNTTGWWVEDISGWWPANSWLKIDGCWYYFDGSGYMVTNRYVEGYWIGADGVCY